MMRPLGLLLLAAWILASKFGVSVTSKKMSGSTAERNCLMLREHLHSEIQLFEVVKTKLWGEAQIKRVVERREPDEDLR